MSLLDSYISNSVRLESLRVSVLVNSNYYYSLYIRKDHLYAASYGKGVEIFFLDPSSSSNPIELIETIIQPGDTTWIFVNENESLIFSTKNHILHINERADSKNLNIDDMPNLMNSLH